MKLYVVGLGPGNDKYMTPQCREAIAESQVIVGYDVYVNLIKHLITEEKEVISTGMTKEADRCKQAIDCALTGKTVSMVCSGDAGVYGMAGIIYEMAKDYPNLEIIVVPGITAACSGAGVLGAPLIHDFSVISLSDLLTPWEKIEKRLLLSAEADFVVCLYNPKSKKRHDYLEKACEIMMKFKSPETPCGYVRNIGRDGEISKLCLLKELKDQEIDMFTTVFVGNSETKIINGKLVTPRGYKGI